MPGSEHMVLLEGQCRLTSRGYVGNRERRRSAQNRLSR